MATLNYDPTPADMPEFNEAEQEALAIGEAQAEAEQQMYAGKFKDAEALEQAYIELQKKLGESKNETDETPEVREEDGTRREEEVNPNLDALYKANQEFAETGQLSEESIEQLSQMDSKDLVNAYMEIQSNAQVQDLSESDVNSIMNSVGGEDSYAQLMTWAGENLPENVIKSFDNMVNTADINMIRLATAGLQAAYQEANGYEGQMLSGKTAADKADVFRSQAEVVQAMADPRYDRDPAYRQDVFNKLDRSNLQY